MILYSQEESWITNLVLLQLLGFHLILQLVRRFSTAVLGPSSWRSADAEAGASNGVDDIYIALAVGAHGWGGRSSLPRALEDGSYYAYGWCHWPQRTLPRWTHHGCLSGMLIVAASDSERRLFLAYVYGEREHVDKSGAIAAGTLWACMPAAAG